MECRIPDDSAVALRLLEMITAPDILVKEPFAFPVTGEGDEESAKLQKSDFAVIWRGEGKHWLNKAWETIFRPNLLLIGDSLSHILIKHLTQSHLLLRGVGKSDDHYDRLSWGRSSIAPHEQNDSPLEEVYAFLVEALRELFDHWIKSQPARARIQANIWWSGNVPILRRFAAYGLAVDPQYTGDEKIDWVLQHDLVFRSGIKKEVFDVMAAGYVTASPARRSRLLRRIDRGYRGPGAKKLSAASLAYEKFNVLIWLQKTDPACDSIRKALDKIRSKYPNFEERDHPNLDHWHVRTVDPKEGFDFDKILKEPPEQYLNTLRKVGESSVPHDRWDHFNNLPTLFERDAKWADGFVSALTQQDTADPELWTAIFSAWRKQLKNARDWRRIFLRIEALPHTSAVYSGVANLIGNRVFAKKLKLSTQLINRAAVLMDRAWDICIKDPEPPDDSYRDWLSAAINHVGGWIGEFWVHYLGNARNRARKTWKGITPGAKRRIVAAINGTSRVAVYARISMTPWLGYLYVWDQKFAKRHLLPLLDWNRDPIVAQQTWSVLLGYKRGTTVALEKQLEPFYLQMVRHLKGTTANSEQFDNQRLQNLGGNLAALVMEVIPNPLESGFFAEFLPLLPDVVRESMAREMRHHLEKSDDAHRKKVWDTWLRQYIDDRLIGIPSPLVAAETRQMLQWPLYLGAAFADAVERVVKMPLSRVMTYGLLKAMLESSHLTAFPRSACRLINAALTAEEHAYMNDELLALHERLKATIPGSAELNAFEAALYARGWKKK
jgi:hypothetical protein